MPAILEVRNLTKSIGNTELFNSVSFVVEQGSKTGLIAKNGIGKSTLLNILHGEEEFNSGEIQFLPGTKTGYLPQEPKLKPGATILEAVFNTGNQTLKLIRDYESALKLTNTALIEKYAQEIDNLKAWDIEAQVKQMLSQLDIDNFSLKISELSGGQLKRVALASVLIDNPDLLILDEPTNHLDISAISWLEGYLKKNTNSLLMVTHDRYFLDRVCNDILELDDKQLFRYRGNYSYFLEKRSERIELRLKEISKASNLLRTEEDWMRRMPKARSTKAKYRINNYYDLKDKASQSIRDDKIKIKVGTERIGKKILVSENLNFSWSGVPFLKDFSYTFSPYEKIGILGSNGCGKSTFLDVLTGKLKPDSGKLETGETIRFGYYRQQGIQFDENSRVLDAVTAIAETIPLADGNIITASQFLTHFLFHPTRQYDYIYKLSGGEKRRLYLCTVLMQNPNFLILDEPTNDLDIATLEVLEDYLINFPGCALIVTHDRYFLDEVVDHLFVFEGPGKIKDFPGNYTDYFEKAKTDLKDTVAIKQNISKPTSSFEKKPVRKLSFNEKREFDQLEQEIENLEQEKKEIENQLNSGSLSNDELVLKSERIGQLIEILDSKSLRWLELAEKNSN